MITKMVLEFHTISKLDCFTWGGGRMVKNVVMEFKLVLVTGWKINLKKESSTEGIYYCMS